MKLAKVAAEEPFVMTAMLSLAAATIWLNLRPHLLLQFFYSAEMLALTHLVTLGFASSIVQGVMQRLAPRTFRLAPIARWRALLQCALYLLGASGVIIHFLLERWTGLAWAALLLVATAVLLAWNFREIFTRALARTPADWPARWIAAALVHFVLASLLGTAYAMVRVYGIGASLMGAPLLDRLAAHLHLALLGWISGTIFGYQLKLLPATRASPRAETWRFVLLQSGLLALVSGLLAGSAAVTRWSALPIAAAIALRSVPAIVRMGNNKPGRWETVAHGLLLALAGTGLALAFDRPAPDSDLRYAVELAYGYVSLFGWVVLTVMGTSWKLFSLWVWEERFLPEKGVRPIPAVYQLPSRLLRDASGSCLTLGVLGVAAAIVAARFTLLRAALALQLLGTVLFLAQFIRIARWELLHLHYRQYRPRDDDPSRERLPESPR